jgi:hypothetical protein
MANFSVNQNRQLYVVNEVSAKAVTKDSAVGAISAHTTLEGETFFKYVGKGGLIRTDLIPKGAGNYASKAPRNYKTKGFKVTLNSEVNGGAPISGQDYILNIEINNYIGFSDEDTYFKFGCVHAHSDMTASTFYKEMALSLVREFSREITPICKFYLIAGSTYTEVNGDTKKDDLTDTYTGLAVYEVEQPWELGTRQVSHVNFKLRSDEVLYEGCERNWGTVEKDTTKEETLVNGKEIADLEYFCMGERGDQYRNVGWPLTIKTEYMVDPTKDYHTVDIHYWFTDEGVSVQKSEKTITFVCPTAAVAASLVAALADAELADVSTKS